MDPSGAICGVTVSFRFASIYVVVYALVPPDEDCKVVTGIFLPCFITADRLSRVRILGLEIILALPVSSIAESLRSIPKV
jgi:hypothetical protein